MPDGLTAGTVAKGLQAVTAQSAQSSAPWSEALAATNPFNVPLPHFNPQEVNPLTPATSKLDETVGKVDTSAASMAKTVGLTMAAYTDFVSTTIDEKYSTPKIKEMQKEFLDKHQGDLAKLDGDLKALWPALRKLIELMQHPPIGLLDGINQTILTKATYGNDTYNAIVAELENATAATPEGRVAQLTKAKADLEAWFPERDARVAADKAEFDQLQKVVAQVAAVARAEAGVASQVLQGKSPGNTTGGGKITSTTHVHPDALHYVSQVKTLLLDMRLGMQLAFIPPTQPPAPFPAPSTAPTPAAAPESEMAPRRSPGRDLDVM